jgi:hypothetical protein
MVTAAALRRDIVHGHIPPGARIARQEYAERYHVGPAKAYKGVKALADEGLVWVHAYHEYTAPAGPPDPDVAARLGPPSRDSARRPAATPPTS